MVSHTDSHTGRSGPTDPWVRKEGGGLTCRLKDIFALFCPRRAADEWLNGGPVQAQLDRIEKKLDAVLQKERMIMATTEQLQTAVNDLVVKLGEVTSAEASIEQLLATNTQMLRDILASGGTPDEIVAQITAAVDTLEVNRQALVAATVANTQPTP